jgi:hypothetical protein
MKQIAVVCFLISKLFRIIQKRIIVSCGPLFWISTVKFCRKKYQKKSRKSRITEIFRPESEQKIPSLIGPEMTFKTIEPMTHE